jgi:hypothetical protein
MLDRPDPRLSERVLETLRQHGGKLPWRDLADALGIVAEDDRYEFLYNLRMIEQSGIVRSEASDGAIRFWIVKKASG